jgi:hypothetical protein
VCFIHPAQLADIPFRGLVPRNGDTRSYFYIPKEIEDEQMPESTYIQYQIGLYNIFFNLISFCKLVSNSFMSANMCLLHNRDGITMEILNSTKNCWVGVKQQWLTHSLKFHKQWYRPSGSNKHLKCWATPVEPLD